MDGTRDGMSAVFVVRKIDVVDSKTRNLEAVD